MLRTAIWTMLAAVPVTLALAWLTTQFRYRITRKHLQVTLFGLPVRRLPLSDIRTISARRLRHGERGEQWWNTLHPSRRFLTIRRRAGLFRYFVITPNHRYIFRAALEKAMRELKLPMEAPEAPDPATGEEDDTPQEGATPSAPPLGDPRN